MDESREEKAMNMTCHRRLDFNLPLLSTRRLGGYPVTNSRIALQGTSNGVPFCWEQAEDDRGLDRLNLESVESRGSESPNFMIERFLPDATALASSSALYASSKNLSKRLPYFCSNYSEEYNSQTVGGYSEESSHKG